MGADGGGRKGSAPAKAAEGGAATSLAGLPSRGNFTESNIASSMVRPSPSLAAPLSWFRGDSRAYDLTCGFFCGSIRAGRPQGLYLPARHGSSRLISGVRENKLLLLLCISIILLAVWVSSCALLPLVIMVLSELFRWKF
jgi:hypothetical protein